MIRWRKSTMRREITRHWRLFVEASSLPFRERILAIMTSYVGDGRSEMQ